MHLILVIYSTILRNPLRQKIDLIVSESAIYVERSCYQTQIDLGNNDEHSIVSGVYQVLQLANTTAFRSVGALPSDPYKEYCPPCNSLPYPSDEYCI